MDDIERAVHRWAGELDYPMFVVTVRAGGERAGCLVGFVTQCSISPLRFLVCLSEKNRTHRVAQRTDTIALHALPARRGDLAELFGSRTGDDTDKFALCGWHDGPAGVPVLDGIENWLVGRVLARMPAGDHQALLVEPIAAAAGEDVRQFSFHRARRLEPGHQA